MIFTKIVMMNYTIKMRLGKLRGNKYTIPLESLPKEMSRLSS